MIAFDHNIEFIEYNTHKQFTQEVSGINAQGGTDFVPSFKKIQSEMKSKKFTDLTILFLTDGQTNANSALAELSVTAKLAEDSGMDLRFFALGFSQYHDAALLGQIARGGNDMGNFTYIQENQANTMEEMSNALKSIFDLVPSNKSFKISLQKTHNDHMTWEKNVRMNLVENKENTYEATFNFPAHLLKLEENDTLKLITPYSELDVKTEALPQEFTSDSLQREVAFFNF